MEKQFGKNPEYHFGLTYNLNKWGLPFAIDWWGYEIEPPPVHKCFNLNIDFLCFRFFLGIWKWGVNEKTKIQKVQKT